MRLMIRVLALCLFSTIILSCNKEEAFDPQRPSVEFRRYISGFTSGVVARSAYVDIHMQEPSIHFTVVGEALDSDILEVSPDLEGELVWTSDRSLRFTPITRLKSATQYDFIFHLGELIDVEDRFAEFPFSIYTRAQSMKVDVVNLEAYDEEAYEWNLLHGIVQMADYMEAEPIEAMLEAELDGTAMSPRWVHSDDGRRHDFYIDSVPRVEGQKQLNLSWDIDTESYENEGELSYTVPSISDFSYRDAQVSRDPEQHLQVYFTDPLDKTQALSGLVRLAGSDDLRLEVEGNVLKVFPKSRLTGPQVLILDANIQNAKGYHLQEDLDIEVDFTELKPEIRAAFSGTIMPSTNGKVFPFQAVNLRAVDVQIQEVFQNNVHQFLQVNGLDGGYQLSRVAKTVLRKKIDLRSDQAIDYGTWNTFTLDLDELITQDPGAIYRVTLNFKPSYSTYPCSADLGDGAFDDLDQEDGFAEEEYYDDYYDDYYYDDYSYYVPGYDWREKDNPCHISYYVNRKLTHNMLASDLAILAKQGKDNRTLVTVNDIKTAQPMGSVTVRAFDYERQEIAALQTDATGQVSFDSDAKPWLLVAERGKERAYLKLGDGNSLSMSHFDVRGRELQDGLKGYIYAERGVWRPGDTLFLNFMLEDVDQKLPSGHPVVMQLTDPRGDMVKKEVKYNAVNGVYDFTMITSDDAPTGMWTAQVKVGAARFSKQLAIETVKPNRLKMDLDFGEFIQEGSSPAQGTLKASWLHGATARNLKAEVSLILRATNVKPKGYSDYTFKDPIKHFDASEQTIYEGRVDDNGLAQIPLDLDLKSTAPGLVRAHFTTKVYEEGGGHSIDRFNIPYSPYESYLGIRMPQQYNFEPGSEHMVSLVGVDKDGEAKAMSGVKVDIYNVSWRWWWDSSRDYLGQYVYDESRYRVAHVDVPDFTGLTEFKFKLPEDPWARYMIRVTDESGGHATGQLFHSYTPWRPGQDNGAMPGGASVLHFQLDKEDYEVGETAKLQFGTGGQGRAYITVEDGTKVIQEEWIDIQQETVDYSLKVTPEMAPNAYVHVSLIQPHSRDNELPIRMYGVVPLMVEDPNTVLEPEIDMPDELRPETSVDISISEANDKAMTYTLALVDEGLLDLTGFKTPNPHASFYAREALGVKTWDPYDDVVGAFGAQLQTILSVGGDEALDGKEAQKVNRFKPMVKHIGPFHIDAGKTAKHSLSIPNYVGSVRVMVIAREDKAYGHAEKTVKVNKPLMVLANLPRVLGPDEEVRLPVSVFAMEEGVKDVEVNVELSGPVELVGEKTLNLHFDQPDEQMAFFDLKTTAGTGKATAKVFVKGNGHDSSYEVELPVRQSRLPETRSEFIVLDKGESKVLDFTHFAMAGTEELRVELSSVPSINLEGRLGYLLRYPHGCAEQTISAAFPQLYLDKVLEAGDERIERARSQVVDVIADLGKFQRSDGSFSLWRGSSTYNDWVTSYVGHFMIEAERAGYDVPDHVYNKWLGHQQSRVKGTLGTHAYYGRTYFEKARAYRLYTLALASKADISSMNRLKNSQLLDKASIYMLAASYHLAGQAGVAKDLVDAHTIYTPKARRDGYSFGSVSRDKAIILECLVQMDRKTEAFGLIQQVAEDLSSDRYMNTQAIAVSLRALLAMDVLERKDMDFTFSLDGQEVDKKRTQVSFLSYELSEQAGTSGTFSFVNHSEGPLYARVIQTGIPTRASQQAVKQNIDLQVNYLDMDGNPIDITRLEQGTEFMVDVWVKNPSTEDPLEHLALTMVTASGWEPNIDRMDGPGPSTTTDTPDYMDIRDDKVMLYFGLDKNDAHRRYSYRKYRKHFRFTVSASYSGNYFMPGIQVESMYDHEVVERKAGQMVEVYRAGS